MKSFLFAPLLAALASSPGCASAECVRHSDCPEDSLCMSARCESPSDSDGASTTSTGTSAGASTSTTSEADTPTRTEAGAEADDDASATEETTP